MSQWRSPDDPPSPLEFVLATFLDVKADKTFVDLAWYRLDLGWRSYAVVLGQVEAWEIWGWMPLPQPANVPAELSTELSPKWAHKTDERGAI